MDKIYRRATQRSDTPKQKKNEKNRVRNKIINFRVSQKEYEMIEARIRTTGMSKSDFFIQSCLYQTILVKGNVKTFSEIKNQIQEVSEAINRDSNIENLDCEQVESFRIILEIMNSLFGKI